MISIVPVKPENGFDSGFRYVDILFHEVVNGPFDTFDRILAKGEKSALEIHTVNKLCGYMK